MFRLALGFIAGYVLGAKAGRERYEQIKRLSAKTADHPAVQGAAGFVRAKVSAGVSAVFSRSRRPAPQPDMAYLDQEPPAGTNGSPTTFSSISA